MAQKITLTINGDIDAHIERDVTDETAIGIFRELKRVLQPDGAPVTKRRGRKSKTGSESGRDPDEETNSETEVSEDSSNPDSVFGSR